MSASTEPDLQTLLNLDFDPDELREKYRVERDLRLRPEGNKQWIKVDGDMSSFMEAPLAGDRAERDPVNREPDVLIIGGGFAGLQTGARLRQAGVEDLLIVERGPDFGGNWYWNRYPGAACDSEAYCYLPLLEETGYVPSHRYVDADELWGHAQRIGRHFGLYEKALFQTNVVSMTWNDETSRWVLESDRGDTFRPRFVVLAGGETYAAIKLPGIPGIRRFTGHSFHTARWDYKYTGGSVRGNLHQLAGKRVAIIGTGCSAVQIIPHLAASAGQVYVFQRTPAFVDPRNNHPTDPEWAGQLTPGWHERRMWDLIANMENNPEARPLNDSGFSDLSNALRDLAAGLSVRARDAGVELSPGEIMELSNMQYMEQVRARVDAIVGDPETAEALKPYYASYCKRPTWSDAYLQAFNQPNVELVACPGGVEEITEKGLVANGAEHEVDLIIYGSGYEVTHSSIFQIARFPIVGRGGVTLEEHWTESYRNLHGMMVHHLPNYFQLTVIGNGLGANYLYGNGKQATHIAWIVAQCLQRKIAAVEPTREAEDEWRKTLDASQDPDSSPRYGAFLRALATCTPGYLNNEGNLSDNKGLFANIYGGGINAYLKLLEDWRDTGEMPGLAVTESSAGVPGEGR